MQFTGKKNNLTRKFLFNFNEKVLTLVLLVLVILLSVPLYNNYHRRQKINSEISDLEAEIKQAEKKDTDLQKLIVYLESDQFVEEQARLNLNMKKPGESVAVVKDLLETKGATGSNQPLAAAARGANESYAIGYIMSWWHYFFK